MIPAKDERKGLLYFHFWASSKLILSSAKWGGVACETTSVHGPQCNFRLRNTTSVHRRQLPSTSASPQYLIHCFQHEWAKNDDYSTARWRKGSIKLKKLTQCNKQIMERTDSVCTFIFGTSLRCNFKIFIKYIYLFACHQKCDARCMYISWHSSNTFFVYI